MRPARRGGGRPRRARRDRSSTPTAPGTGARTSRPRRCTSTGYELFGYVSFRPGGEDREPSEFAAVADFTPETAAENPDWELDLCEEVIGVWRGERGDSADMTLVWGRPLVERGEVVTAELAGLVVDQCALVDDRFTLLAPDGYRGGTLECKLFDDRRQRDRARVALRGRRRGRGRAARGGPRGGDPQAAARTRPTRPDPVDRETLDELFELARWAPNHKLTNPWRFRVLGPQRARAPEGRRRRSGRGGEARPRADARRRLGDAVGRRGRSTRRTSARRPPRPTSCCSPRTAAAWPATGARRRMLRTPEGRAAVGVGDGERVLGLLHLGHPRQEPRAPERAPLQDVVDVPRLTRAPVHARPSVASADGRKVVA